MVVEMMTNSLIRYICLGRVVHLAPGGFRLRWPITFCAIGHQSHAWENPEVRRMGLIIFIWSLDVHLFQASGTVKPEEPDIIGLGLEYG